MIFGLIDWLIDWSIFNHYIETDNGFSVLFDIESFDYGYYDEGSEGLKVYTAKSNSWNFKLKNFNMKFQKKNFA